jgi:hypothetical protein
MTRKVSGRTLADTLTVRASRKGNPFAKNRRISRGFRLACLRAAQRDYSLFWFDFSYLADTAI